MEERIVQFAKALRAGGAPVSQAETLDAMRAVSRLGIRHQSLFRSSLRATLIKSGADAALFDELFPLFFLDAGAPPAMNDGLDDVSEEEARMLAQALRQLRAQLAASLQRLLRGEPLTPKQKERLAALAGLNRARNLRYRDWMVRRMQRALGHDEVRRAMQELSELLAQLGLSKERLQQMQDLLQANMEAEAADLHQFAGQRITDNMQARPPRADADELMQAPFGQLSEDDMNALRHEVRRLAARLRSRIALRQKREKSGQLDLKATFRQNLRYGSVPFRLAYRRKQKQPKLVVICDISTSMRYCSELMLSLVFAMQDQISKTSAFAFNDHLEYISPDFAGKTSQEAVDAVLVRMPPGHYSTDLGGSLRQFQRAHFDLVDARTTLLLVGDARNNYRDPALDAFAALIRRCRRAIWLNPEAPFLWGTGDSDMLEYAPHCHHVFQVQTMAELTTAVDDLLTQ